MSRDNSVYCLARDERQAFAILDALRSTGFSENDISVLFPDTSTSRDLGHVKASKAPEGATAGGAAGGVLGGALGWLAGLGALAIPGVGPLIAAGPILAALSGAAVGAAVGGLTGGLIGMGIPEYEAKRFAGKIREGRVLIAVHAESGEQEDLAKRVYREHGAEDVGASSEASVRPTRG